MLLPTEVFGREQFRHALALQATWNTAITDDTAYRQFYLTEDPSINWGNAPRSETARAGHGLVKHIQDVHLQEIGADPTFSLKGKVTNEELQFLIYGIMQGIVSEGAIAPYMRTHRWNEAFTGMDGITPAVFFSFAEYDPAGYSTRLKNCVLSRLKLSADPGSQNGVVLFEADFQSFGVADRNATLAPSSWVAHGTTLLTWNNLQARTLATLDLLVAGWELTLESGVSAGPSQDANGNRELVRISAPRVTASVKTTHDANTKLALATYLTNPMGGSADAALYLRYGTSESTNQMLALSANVIYTGPRERDMGNASGVLVTLPFEGVSDGTNPPIEIKHANNTDMAWT